MSDRAAGRKRRAPKHSAPSTGSQIAAFIARFDPQVARVLRAARAVLRKRYPTANELVYDNYNALAIGYSSTDRVSDVIVSLATYASGVNLYFMYGRSLSDPTRILQGSGRQGAFVRLDTVARLDDPAVEALLRAAEADGETPLPQTGRGRTIIKSVSARQRPRRAARTRD